MAVTLLERLGVALLVSLIGFAGLAGPGGYSKAMETALTRELRETSVSILLQRPLVDRGPSLLTLQSTGRGGNP